MKTAMQELIEHIHNDYIYPHQEVRDYMDRLNNKIKDLLEKEKEQIINTYEIGSSHGMGVIEDGLDYIHGIEYFDQTYNK